MAISGMLITLALRSMMRVNKWTCPSLLVFPIGGCGDRMPSLSSLIRVSYLAGKPPLWRIIACVANRSSQ